MEESEGKGYPCLYSESIVSKQAIILYLGMYIYIHMHTHMYTHVCECVCVHECMYLCT